MLLAACQGNGKDARMSQLPVSPLAPSAFPDLPAIRGISVQTAAMGMKYQNRDDLTLITLPEGSRSVAVFTRSKTVGAPVDWSRDALQSATGHRALLINAGNANAFTGAKGAAAAAETARLTAEKLGVDPQQVLLASTGVIGEVLPTAPVAEALNSDLKDADFEAAAKAICTTDTFAKGASVRAGNATLTGIAKGSGMIQPDMATMLAFVFTDADLPQETLQAILRRATDRSFNAITVDSDTSTSDSLFLSATGAVPVDETVFEGALEELLQDLAKQVVRDGEGASKFIEVQVTGAEDDAAARRIGLSVANSPLVKTAIAGEDANWGRIVMAVGKSGEQVDRDRLSIAMGGVTIAKEGGPVDGYDETPVAAHMAGEEIVIQIGIGLGSGSATVWTCDLTHGYISINADYRS